MIDPITALAGITSAISMVKKAAQVANDLGSLAPMIGKMFDAKSTATKALMESKKTGGKSTWEPLFKLKWLWSRPGLSKKN